MPDLHPKRTPIGNFQAGDEFEDVFIVEAVKKRLKKSGEPFIGVELADRTGKIEAMVWNDVAAFEQRGYKRDQYVLAKGVVGEYNGKLNATLRWMRPLTPEQIMPEDFVAVSPRDPEEMEGELRALIASVGDEELRTLLELAFDPRGKLFRDFRIAPSARSVHQAYLHGLLEHTLNVTTNALGLASAEHNARLVNRDLLVAGALLHDIGKTVEYRWSPRIDFTEAGLLLGHISIGNTMVAGMARQLTIAPGKVAHLQHLVLSHHGKMEYGSPRLPATAEAFILHYADYADAQLAVYEELAAATRARGESQSEYSPFIERRILALESDFAEPAAANAYLDDLAELAKTPR